MKHLITTIGILGLTGCGAPTRSQLDSIVPGSTHIKPAGMGTGYDSERSTWKSRCVQGERSWIGQNRAILSLDANLSMLDLKKRIYGDLEVGFENAGLSIQGEATYEKASAANEQSLTVNYLSRMTTKSLVLSEPQLTTLGSSYIDGSGQVSDDVANGCGDEFVNQIDYGASLAVTVKISFLNNSDRELIHGKASLDVGILKIAGELESLDESVKKNTSIRIMATQVGGDIKYLASILPPEGIFCPLRNFDDCRATLKALGYYATLGFPESEQGKVDADPETVASEIKKRLPNIKPFHAQFDKEPDEKDLYGWADLSFVTKKFADQAFLVDGKPVRLIPKLQNPIVTQAIKQARIFFVSQIEKQNRLGQRARDVVGGFHLTEAKRAQLVELGEAADFNAALATGHGVTCYSQPEQCAEAKTFYTENEIPIDASTLNLAESDLVPEIPPLPPFTALCKGSSDPAVHATVRNVLDLLKTEDCSEANNHLDRISAFVAPDSGLVSTKVLALLPELQSINAPNSHLTDLDLLELKNLRKIYIAKFPSNQITDLSFFSAWPELIYLDLQWNPLDSNTMLTGLPRFWFANVSNTGLTSLAPFRHITGTGEYQVVIAAENNEITSGDDLTAFKQSVLLQLRGNPFKGPCPAHQVGFFWSACDF